MDIELFFAVLRRFWKIVLGGLVLAIALAYLAHMHRSVTWASQAEAQIVQASPANSKGSATGSASDPAAANNPAALSGLAPIYVQYANANAVQGRLKGLGGKVVAAEVTDPSDGLALPFVGLTATAPSASVAVNLTHRAFTVLSRFITEQQISAGVGPHQRATLELIENGDPALPAGGSSTTITLLVFVGVLGAAIAIAFMLENARPQSAAKLGRVPAGPGFNRAPAYGGHANGTGPAAEPLRSDLDEADVSEDWLDGLVTGGRESSRSG